MNFVLVHRQTIQALPARSLRALRKAVLLASAFVLSGFTVAAPLSSPSAPLAATSLALNAGPDRTAGEGRPLALLDLPILNAGNSTNFTATVTWGDGASSPARIDLPQMTISAGHIYTEEGNYLLTVALQGSSGENASDTVQVTVTNIPPIVIAGPHQAIEPGETVELKFARFADPGLADAHTADVDWGDGTSTRATIDPASGTIAANHLFPSNDVYTVTSLSMTTPAPPPPTPLPSIPA